MNPTISVIVPIYKVEKYLDKCINSIINQTYKNLEIILVDDGSPDKCPQICDQYKKKDGRIKVIHKPNGGLSDARNAGMKIASGQYISFIDSDDYVSDDFIETLYDVMKSEKSDIVECETIKFCDGEVAKAAQEEFNTLTVKTEEGLKMLIAENGFHQHVWNKLYKAEIVKGVYFEKGKLNEDEFWTYQIFGKAKKISKINKPMYYYLQQRSTSIMGNTFGMRRLDALEAKEQRQKYIEKYFPDVAVQSKIDLFGTCIFMCQSAMRFMEGNEKRKAVTIIKEQAGKCRLTRSELEKIQGKNRFWFGFANKFFVLCCKVRSVTGIGF